jgi:hypothetical protein
MAAHVHCIMTATTMSPSVAFAKKKGRFKRRKAQFSRTWCIMIDDVGTKIPQHSIAD